MKKIISATLASILAVSALSAVAFAEETTAANTYSIEAAGTVAKPAIKVTLPKSMAFVFNPYKLSIDAKGKIATGDGSSNDVIVGAWTDTTNKSWDIINGAGTDLKAAVYAYATKAVGDDFEVVDATGTPTTTKKGLKLTIQAAGGTDGTAAAAVKLQENALAEGTTIWAAAAATTPTALKVAKVTDKLQITMTGTTTNAATPLEWTEDDKPTVNFLFAFDFADPA